MSVVRFTHDAEADIFDLHDYTIQTFGERQWQVYEASMRTAIAAILASPQIGADRAFIRADTRRFLFKSHVIYYEIDGTDILVLRILGVRQDPGRHL